MRARSVDRTASFGRWLAEEGAKGRAAQTAPALPPELPAELPAAISASMPDRPHRERVMRAEVPDPARAVADHPRCGCCRHPTTVRTADGDPLCYPCGEAAAERARAADSESALRSVRGGPEDWQKVRELCEAAGLESSPLRDAGAEHARAEPAEPAPETVRAALLAFRFRDTEASLAPEWVNELTRWLALFSWESALRERALREALERIFEQCHVEGHPDYPPGDPEVAAGCEEIALMADAALARPPSASADALAALLALPGKWREWKRPDHVADQLVALLRAAGLETT